jgi:pseudaminic acid synthase
MDEPRIHVAGREIGEGRPCFVVAELSGNHAGSRERAFRLVEEAAAAGCDAVKLQTYTADTMTIACDKEWFVVVGRESPEAWKGRTLHQLYQEARTPWEWHEPLQGEPFTSRILRCIRAAFGLAPSELERVLGRRAAKAIEAGTPLAWELVE